MKEEEQHMNWFKNLNATPRLMSSFGVLLVLTLGISYLAISGLSKANDRVDLLYHQDMVGATYANGITIDVTSIRGDDLNAMARAADPAAVASSEKAELANAALLHADLDGADKLFVTKKGMEQLSIIRKTLPDYERAQADLFSALKAKDMAAADVALATCVQYRTVILNASDVARQLKTDHAEDQFQTNVQAYQTARTLMLSASLVSLVLGLILSIVIARGFSLPLGMAVDVLEKVAEGDLTVSLDVETTDEVGRMAQALNRAVERLNSTLQQVASSAASASNSSQELAAAAETIAAGAQEQAASLEETSASLEEITAAVRQSADNANQASQLAASSKDSALQGQDVVSNAITAMSEINAASAKISDIISTIDEIAFQTNLLAVNAAVEAARAGEEGRGFAVVASEVRSLAQRSAVAAKEIKVLIQDSLRKVDAGSGLVNRSGETLHGIVGSVKRVTDIVGEIAAASGEQSTGIEQVNTAMTQMDQVTQANSAQTEELSATAQALSEQSARLMELVATFTLDRDGKNARGHQFFEAHEESPAHAVGVSLVHSAKPGLANSVQAHSAAQSNRVAQRSSKAGRNAASAKAESRTRSKNSASRQPALAVATASEAGGSDASFEEF
jgi:methyl-accepting chemotaxis protein